MTQSPQEKIYFEPEGIVILKQPERTFILSNNELNLLIENSYETREYVSAPYYEPRCGELCELKGECLNGARAILVSSDNHDKPPLCQVKFRWLTKTYTFVKIHRTGGRNAFR